MIGEKSTTSVVPKHPITLSNGLATQRQAGESEHVQAKAYARPRRTCITIFHQRPALFSRARAIHTGTEATFIAPALGIRATRLTPLVLAEGGAAILPRAADAILSTTRTGATTVHIGLGSIQAAIRARRPCGRVPASPGLLALSLLLPGLALGQLCRPQNNSGDQSSECPARGSHTCLMTRGCLDEHSQPMIELRGVHLQLHT